MTRIIGIGSLFASRDAAGLRVCDLLLAGTLPAGLEVIDGGLGGIDLLRFMENTERIVFVDSVEGFSPPGQLVVLTADEIAAAAEGYGHGAGLPYLLRVLPEVCTPPCPEVFLVGVEGPPSDRLIRAAAHLAVKVALGNDGQCGRRAPEYSV